MNVGFIRPVDTSTLTSTACDVVVLFSCHTGNIETEKRNGMSTFVATRFVISLRR